MLELNPDDIVIQRVHIKARGIRHNRVVEDLNQVRWPRPRRDEWLFLRRLAIRSPLGTLGVRVSAQAHQLAASAVDGTSNSAAEAEAVRFSSLHEMLAQLSLELARATGRTNWYWQSWAQLFRLPAAEAIQSLWSENVSHLAGITLLLRERGELATVWQALNRFNAQALIHRLEQFTSLPLHNVLTKEHGGQEYKQSRVGMARRLEIPLRKWLPVVAHYKADDPRRLLAAIVMAIQHLPQHLSQDPSGTVQSLNNNMDSWIEKNGLVSTSRNTKVAGITFEASDNDHTVTSAVVASLAVPQGQAPISDHNLTEKPSKKDIPANHQEPDMTSSNASIKSPLDLPVTPAIDDIAVQTGRKPVQQGIDNESTSVSKQASGMQLRETMPGNSTVERPSLDLPQLGTERAPEISPPGLESGITGRSEQHRNAHDTGIDSDLTIRYEGELHTTYGGLFYLLNFINRVEVQHLIEQHGGMTQLESGWEWLYRLGLGMGMQPEPPLMRLFAHWMETPVEQLAARGPLPMHEELMVLGESLYENQEVWDHDLIQAQAQLLYTTSHVDLFYHLDEVQLPLRLSGLDINPGWVPWLGRVVSFHYQATDESMEELP